MIICVYTSVLHAVLFASGILGSYFISYEQLFFTIIPWVKMWCYVLMFKLSLSMCCILFSHITLSWLLSSWTVNFMITRRKIHLMAQQIRITALSFNLADWNLCSLICIIDIQLISRPQVHFTEDRWQNLLVAVIRQTKRKTLVPCKNPKQLLESSESLKSNSALGVLFQLLN